MLLLAWGPHFGNRQRGTKAHVGARVQGVCAKGNEAAEGLADVSSGKARGCCFKKELRWKLRSFLLGTQFGKKREKGRWRVGFFFFFLNSSTITGFPGGATKEPACQCRRRKRCGFHPWVGKIPWSRKWHPTSVFWPGESHEQRSLGSHKGSDMTEHPPIHSTVITICIMTIVAINITPSGWRRHKLPFQKNKTDEESRTPLPPRLLPCLI